MHELAQRAGSCNQQNGDCGPNPILMRFLHHAAARHWRAGIIAAVIGSATLPILLACHRDMHEAELRISGRSFVMRTASGRLEYAVSGRGPAVLMIHGTGGGFDQGLAFTEGLVRRGYQVIAPSRFGYLRSDYPDDPSSERQADALVELLDKLGVQKIAVAGGSAGALSAAQLALRHPERCAALILVVPAANVRGSDPVAMTPVQEFLVRQMASSDFLFWTGLKLRHADMVGTLLATDPAVVARGSPAEQLRVNRILREILPVSARTRGMLNDARLAGHPARMEFRDIRAPTLVISVEDDRFGTASTARDIAAAVPHSRLVIYPTGGHVWVGHDEELWSEVDRFLGST